jgi:hypothetical protein
MNKHTPGFYLIELQRTQRQYDIACAKLAHAPHNDKVALKYNATRGDYVLALIKNSPFTDDTITEIENRAYEYIKMSRMKRLIFDIKSHFK